MADIEGEGTHCSKELLEYIHINKTAALLVSTIRAGAYLGGADAKTLVDLTTYGEQLGLLFQITDDILDACGDEDEMGKKTGVDVAKTRLPMFLSTALKKQSRWRRILQRTQRNP